MNQEKLLKNVIKHENEDIPELRASLDNIVNYLTPKMFNDNIQLTIDTAIERNIKKVILEGKVYTTETTILIPSNFTLEGVKGVTTIKLIGVNKPIISKKGSIESNTHIKNIVVYGDKTHSENHGIVLNDYWSSVEGCEVKNCGGDGIKLNVGGATGNLVENKIIDCIVRDCKGTSYNLGHSDNNKLTDGYLLNCISQGSGENKAIFCGSASGWQIKGVHTYGHWATNGVVDIQNSFNTIISDMYIEDFKNKCFLFYKTQRNLVISNITFKFSNISSNNLAFDFNKSSIFNQGATVSINNLSIVNDTNSIVNTVFNSDKSWVDVVVNNISLTGSNPSDIILIGDNIKNDIKIVKNLNISGSVNIQGTLNGTASNKLSYDGYSLCKYKRGTFGGSSSAVELKIPIANLPEWGKMICRFSIHSRAYFDGDKRITYGAELLLTRKSGTSAYITASSFLTSSGFNNTPKYTYNTTTKELEITFTPSNSDGEGVWVFEIFD